jgi:hypothetical protein
MKGEGDKGEKIGWARRRREERKGGEKIQKGHPVV